MSKTWLIALGLSPALVAAQTHDREYVVAAITCVVGDPKDLGSELGLKKGNRIVVESLNTKMSTFFIEDEAYVTGFPADLKFSDKRFRFEGTEIWDETNHLSLRIEGEMQKPQLGYLYFEYRVDDVRRIAIADLIDCIRRR